MSGELEFDVEGILSRASITHRNTKAGRPCQPFPARHQDFIIPGGFNPQVVIGAKIGEDESTVRDKVTRVQHLGPINTQSLPRDDPPRFEVVACIAGRGFKVRREDLKKLIIATRGKVFTLQTHTRLVECTRLNEYRAKEG